MSRPRIAGPGRAALVLPTDLFVQESLPVPAVRMLRVARLLQASGFQVHAVEWLRWSHGLPETESKEGIEITRLSMKPPPGGAARRLSFFSSLTRAVRDRLLAIGPQGIVIQDGELLLASALAAGRLRVPLFYDNQEHWVGMVRQERPLDALAYDLIERWAAPRIAHVYATSDGVARRFRGLGCRATVIANSRDLSDVRRHQVPKPAARQGLGLGENDFVAGFSGTLDPHQGIETCLEALAGLPGDVKLVIIGGPVERLAAIRSRAQAMNLAHRLVTVPPVDPARLTGLQSAFDVGLIPVQGRGPNFEHRLPLKTFEYMALGLPTIVSAYPDLLRLAVEEVGFALPMTPGDAVSLCDQILKLKNDPALRDSLRVKGREAFEKTYCGEQQAKRILASHEFWRGREPKT